MCTSGEERAVIRFLWSEGVSGSEGVERATNLIEIKHGRNLVGRSSLWPTGQDVHNFPKLFEMCFLLTPQNTSPFCISTFPMSLCSEKLAAFLGCLLCIVEF